MTNIEQEGIYRGKSSTPFRDIYIKPTYIIDKALGIFFWKVSTLGSGNLFGLLENLCQNLTKMI